jgi:hypothetical protein
VDRRLDVFQHLPSGKSTGLGCQGGNSRSPWFGYMNAFGIMRSCGNNLVNGTVSAANYTSMDAAYARTTAY